MKYEFIKMQASGNDYIYFEREVPVFFAEKLSRRRFSVGSDGVVLLLPSKVADVKMRIFNADGSEGNTCGNALRCVGGYLSEKFSGKKDFTVETASGIVPLHCSEGKTSALLGKATVGVSRKLIFEEREFLFYPVSVGNFHAVTFADPADVEKIGPFAQNSPLFDEIPNVEFAKFAHDGIHMRVWEKGSGETLSCSSGAAATVAVCERLGLIKKDETVSVKTSGGETEVTVTSEGIIISGDFHVVYRGVFEDETLR